MCPGGKWNGFNDYITSLPQYQMPGTGLCMEDGNEDDPDLRGLLAQRGNQKVSESYNTVG